MENYTQSFSVYLIKEGENYQDIVNAGGFTKAAASKLENDQELYVLQNAESKTWWSEYFGCNPAVMKKTSGALLFVPSNGRRFVFSFGYAFHKLNDHFEDDFGLKVALNCLDPQKISESDLLNPLRSSRKRTGSKILRDIEFLGFDSGTEIIKGLSGKVRDTYRDLFKSVSGKNSLSFRKKVSAGDIFKLCDDIYKRYASDEYKSTFPSYSKIKKASKEDEHELWQSLF